MTQTNHTQTKRAVHFGAGNIGRGFIGPLLSASSYHVIFVDIQDEVIDALNTQDSYTVQILDAKQKEETISDFSGVKTTAPDAVQAVAEADVVTTSVGPAVLEKVAPTIAKGIAKRKEQGKGDLTIIACENMVGATDKLKEYVVSNVKKDGKDDVLRWVDQHVGFANCEVDRIVPPTKPNGDANGNKDELAVGVEGFYEWVVEKAKVKGCLDIKGMQLTDDLGPFLERKLYTLNCGHAILSYLGHVKGYSGTKEAISDPEIHDITLGALRESGAALVKRHGFDPKKHEGYIQQTISRYENPNIDDEVSRVSRNPLRKLSPKERLIGPIDACKEFGLPRDNLLKGVAAAFYFDEPEDEESVQLMKMVKEKGIHEAVKETTKFEEGSEELGEVVKEYENLKAWTK